MARRGMTGQLNMFDFFRLLDSGSQGEVEMVSLVPEFDEEAEVEIESDVLPEPEPETGAEIEIVLEPEAEAEAELEVVPEPEAEAEAELEVVPEPEAEAEAELEVVLEPEPEAETEAEVEIVPEPEDAPEPEAATVFEAETEKVAMSRQYEISGKKIEIAYINYNKVRITYGSQVPIIREFASSKEAVDFYVEKMQEYEDEKG